MGRKSLNSLRSFIFDKGITLATFQMLEKYFQLNSNL